MTYPLNKTIHQPTLSVDLSDALGRAVRVAQRPPADSDEPGALVVVDDATGEELDDLDAETVVGVIDAHVLPEPAPDPDEEMRDKLANFPTDGSPKQLADLLAGSDGGTRVPGRRP